MSQENVEIVRRQFKLWSEGDLDGWGQCWTHDVVVIPPDRWPEGGEIRGLDAWRRQAERLRDSWEQARIEIDEIRPVGPDQVVSRFRYVTQGKDGEMSFDTSMAVAYVVRDRKIEHATYCWKFEEALEAAGLSE